MAKPILSNCRIHKNDRRNKKTGDKDGKVMYKLMNNAVYGKTMENVRNRIDMKLVSNEKDSLKWTSKPSYVLQKNI